MQSSENIIPIEQRVRWVEELVKYFEDSIGKEILIFESVSRSRGIGKHDRHFAAHSQFKMRLKEVGISFSGTNLTLGGEDIFYYGIAGEQVVKVRKINESEIEVTEWFEEKTERLSKIRILAEVATE